MQNHILHGENETLEFGKVISNLIQESLEPHFEFHLQGELGAGKTTLVRGILRSLGWEGSVKSPTYTMCEEYEFNEYLILHIDLYRTETYEDIEMLDLGRRFDGKKIIFIEWPENLKKDRDFDLKIEMLHAENSRKIVLIGDTILLNSLKANK